jgi:hypothetical protein
MLESETPDFTGCVLHCQISGAGGSEYAVESVLLEFAEWRSLGGRLFLFGRTPEPGPSEWIAGRETGVAWDSVSSFVVFRTREQYLESMHRYKPSLKERLFR